MGTHSIFHTEMRWNMKDDTCKVKLDGVEFESNDFVAILAKDNGDASLFYCTDALTLGMAMKLVARSFIIEMEKLSDDERQSIAYILGDNAIEDFITEELVELDANVVDRMTLDA